MNKILSRLLGLPPSKSVRVPNGRRLQEGLKVPFPADWIFRQRDFLLVQAKHMILSVIFKNKSGIMVRFFLVRINSSVSWILSLYDHEKCTDDCIGHLVILIHHTRFILEY